MKQAIIAMMIYVIIFGILTIISFSSMVNHLTLFTLEGFPTQGVNVLVFVFSVAGLFKSFYHIFRIEL
jgi:hypothetical protein